MATRCPHCDAVAVATEGYSNQEEDAYHQVCTECGAIINEGCLRSRGDFSDSGTVYVNHDIPNKSVGYSLPKKFVDQNTSSSDKITECKLLCLQKIKRLVQFFSGGDNLLNLAKDLFERAYSHKFFKHKNSEHKELLASCCVIIACREKNFPVTMDHMSSLVGCSQFKLGSVLKELHVHLNIIMKGLDLDSYVDFMCQKLELADEVTLTTKKLIPIMKEAWVTEGRAVETTVKAVAYFAWQSHNYGKEKLVLYNGNRKTPCFGKHKTYNKRVVEVRTVLCKLASAIPWLSSIDIKPKEIPTHIKDIISMQKFLFMQLRSSDHVGDTNTPCSSGENATSTITQSEPCLVSQISPGKKCCESSELAVSPEPSKRQKCDDEANNTQNSLFSSHITEFRRHYVSPRFKAQKRSQPPRITEQGNIGLSHLDSELLSELDIPDSEIDLYLKSPDNLKECDLIKKKSRKS